jgi:SET domain-containing protein
MATFEEGGNGQRPEPLELLGMHAPPSQMTKANVHVELSPFHGRGVFATLPFADGDVIEECPVIVLPASEREQLDRTVVYNYYFAWSGGDGAIALGCGSLYNHSFKPNAKYETCTAEGVVRFTALVPIEACEEITVNYNRDPASQAPLWFTPAPLEDD